MTDSWRRFRSDLRELKEASGMNFRAIEEAARAADAFLPRSTVHGLLGEADKRAGKECTGQLEDLVEILVAHTADDDPAAAPWQDRAAWQRRWEVLDDAGRGGTLPDSRTGGALGWDGALGKLGLGADTEAVWLKGPRLSRIAAVIGELQALGLYRQAHDVAGELLRCAEGMLAPHDPGMLAGRHVAAYWTGEAGEVRTARDLTATLLADCREVLGEEHPLSRLAGLRLAAWTSGAGDPAEGRRLYRELARGGPDDRITLLARLGGARAALMAGEGEEAMDRLSRLLPDLAAEYAEHHPVVLGARLHQAQAHRVAGRAAHSLELLEGLVADATAHLDRAHPLTLHIRARHANAVWANGHQQRALELAEETYADAVRVVGAAHPDTLFAGNALAIILAGLDTDAAAEMFRHLYERAGDVSGVEHSLTLAIGHNLAVVVQRNDPQAARQLYEEVREAQTRVLGAEHPETLLTRMNIALTVLALEGAEVARPLFEEVHCARVRVLGYAHPHTEYTRGFLVPGDPEPEPEPAPEH
ncbi:tetratricopeptide repeat protein [Streptomyces sp. NPDC048269]|uniref:tetratricopeptide repeat protein n=1 Tax=Streptomyces sp. NPDC048269 TaxID=3155753 RepID=UPI0034361A41